MMVDLYRNFKEDLSHERLFLWHSMLMNGRRDVEHIGSYRKHEDPMQIVSGAMGKRIVHFEAPPSAAVEKEMNGFISWFNQNREVLPALERAGIAHLYFESIHPFEDGNGRIGRAISELALSQYMGSPSLIAISSAIERNKKAYYNALHANSKNLEITDWLLYFSDTILQAQADSQSLLDFILAKGKFYRMYEASLNERQKKVIDRIFEEGVEGFSGGLSAKNYKTISNATDSTATRDLQKLVELGAMKKKGERKGTRYQLNIDHSAFELE